MGPSWGATDVGVVAAPVNGASGDVAVVDGFVVDGFVVELPLPDEVELDDVVVEDSELEPQADSPSPAPKRTQTTIRGVRTALTVPVSDYVPVVRMMGGRHLGGLEWSYCS